MVARPEAAADRERRGIRSVRYQFPQLRGNPEASLSMQLIHDTTTSRQTASGTSN